MTYLIIKALLSGIIVMIVSEVARRSPGVGGLIASLPLVSILGIIWLWRDTSDTERIAAHAGIAITPDELAGVAEYLTLERMQAMVDAGTLTFPKRDRTGTLIGVLERVIHFCWGCPQN